MFEDNDRENRGRAFVPLSAKPFHWFKEGKKKWELRKCGRQYSERHIWVGRRVELRHGYRLGESLWGTVTHTLTAESLPEFFSKIDYRSVIPDAMSLEEAYEFARSILNIPEGSEMPVFAFRIELDK